MLDFLGIRHLMLLIHLEELNTIISTSALLACEFVGEAGWLAGSAMSLASPICMH